MLGSFTSRKSTTWDRPLYFPSEGRSAEDFFALKIRRLLPGLNPRTWVLKASSLPLDHRSRSYKMTRLKFRCNWSKYFAWNMHPNGEYLTKLRGENIWLYAWWHLYRIIEICTRHVVGMNTQRLKTTASEIPVRITPRRFIQCERILLKKLTVSQLVSNSPGFTKPQSAILRWTSHLSLSWVIWI